MKIKSYGMILIRWFVTTVIWFGLSSIDFWGFQLNPDTLANPVSFFLVAGLISATVAFLVYKSLWSGWKLTLAIFFLVYGFVTALVAVEAVYLSNILTPDLAATLFVNGALSAAVFSPVVVFIWGKMIAQKYTPASPRLPVHWAGLIWRSFAAGIVWVVLFIFCGLLIFQPIARAIDPQALDFYANMETPSWILMFQMARGIIMAWLGLPFIAMTGGNRRQTGLLLGMAFAVLMGSNLLIPTQLPYAVQSAHFIEVTAENFFFGLFVAILFLKRPA